ncbi:MAG TPA: hypothetical protein VKV26_20530 [Dehalococcoidia bacterium]|nr:hypothetical protein [Dehalococcoidia bacterium]
MGGEKCALLFVQADVEPGHEAEWNGWYNRKHVPDLRSVPGITSGRRFEVAAEYPGVGPAGSLPRYLALYDLENAAVLSGEAYAALSKPPLRTDEDRAMLRLFRNVNRAVFEQISDGRGQASDPTTAAGGQLAVGLVPKTGYDEEYNAWYDDEHIPLLLKVPGVLRARRFRALEGEPRYLALYDLAAPEVRHSPAFSQAADTPWSARMRAHCERRLTGLYRPVASS